MKEHMWIEKNEIWLGFEKAKVMGNHENKLHPLENRGIKDGDIIELVDAMNGNGYYTDASGRCSCIPINRLEKVID